MTVPVVTVDPPVVAPLVPLVVYPPAVDPVEVDEIVTVEAEDCVLAAL